MCFVRLHTYDIYIHIIYYITYYMYIHVYIYNLYIHYTHTAAVICQSTTSLITQSVPDPKRFHAIGMLAMFTC